MKRILLASSVALSVLTISPGRSNALIVECANCSDITNQLIEKAQQAKQIATQALQYKTQLDQYTNQIINTTQLPFSVWSSVMSDINQVRNLANAASILTGNSGSILSRLQSAQGYSAQATYLPQNISAQFSMYQQTMGNSLNSLGRTLGVQQQQQIGYANQQQQIAVQSQAAVGQMQVLQAGNETLGLISTQMNQVQTTLTAAAQEQATQDAIMNERKGIADAYDTQFLSTPYASMTGYGTYR